VDVALLYKLGKLRKQRNILTVVKRMVSLFAKRFSPNHDDEVLRSYLTDKLGKTVTCRKIDPSRKRFVVMDIYDPQFWPEGNYVCHYFEARRSRESSDGSAGASGGGTDVQQHSVPNTIVLDALQGSSSQMDAQVN